MVLKSSRLKKNCEYCNKEYLPIPNQYTSQKYCSQRCKWNKRVQREKKLGIFKGGYNRETYIYLWLDAMGLTDITAPCHYCGIALYPDKFVIDHKIPRVKLKTRKKTKDINNLVISCHICNNEKAQTDYNEFIKGKHGRNK